MAHPGTTPASVFAYLGRYTHRVAISNHRIVAMDRETVTFRYRDYADGNRQKMQKVTGVEFVRRFLLHVLPRRFVRLRHYGLHAAGNVGTKLVRARERIEAAPPLLPEYHGEVAPSCVATPASAPASAAAPSPPPPLLLAPVSADPPCCPRCGSRNLQRHSLLSVYELARAPPVAS